MTHGLRRWLAYLLLITVLSTTVPHGTARATGASEPSPLLPHVETRQVAPLTPHRLPSLTLDLMVNPVAATVGSDVQVTVTVSNHANDPATDVVISLPLPDGAAAMSGADRSADGWRWTLARLDGHTSHTVKATLRLTVMPPGQALILRPQVRAHELDAPINEVGGALVQPAAVKAGAVSYTRGRTTTLRSAGTPVTIAVPAGLSTENLRLTYTPQPRAGGVKAGPALRGFGAFALEATNARGRAVHRFDQPVTIQVRYTPEQLLALGISEADLAIFWLDEQANAWVPQPTTVDSATGIASTQVDHFSQYQLGDLSSPSEAFLPTVQGWQVGLYNGAASFSYPIEVPAGPAGIKPNLSLSYSSASNDGKGGQRWKQQAGWAGLGWSLDTGSVVANKLPNGTNAYALAFDGVSTDLVRGNALVQNPNTLDPTHWEWVSSNDSFVKVRVVGNDLSTANRGASSNGQWQPRHTWQVWTKNGVRFDFAEDLWWGWDNCLTDGKPSFETYKWLLSSVTDPSGNTITYSYGRDSVTGAQLTCSSVNYGTGRIDRDAWPTEITWGGDLTPGAPDRHRVEFVSSARANDTQFDGAQNQYGGPTGQPRQTRALDGIRVYNRPAAAWELVRQYAFTYDYSLLSDHTIVTNGVPGANTAFPKLTLKSITRVGKDGTSALPTMSFGYGTARGTTTYPNGEWNRLTSVNNGQGGTVAFTYQTIATATGNSIFANNRRITARTVGDGRGNSATWTYAYTNPAYNSLGTILAPNTGATQAYANSAALYFNTYWDVLHNNSAWLSHKAMSEFRGHSQVVEIDPAGNQTEHSFYQGDVGCNPSAQGSTTGIDADACFRQLRDREVLKGKEYRTVVKQGSSTVLSESVNTYAVEFYDYTINGLTGTWRAFSYQSEAQQKTYEGGATPVVKRTTYTYSPSSQSDGRQYGNLSRKDEYDAAGALYRRTSYSYETLNTATSYIVDQLRAETVLDGQLRILAHTNHFYDDNTAQFGIGDRGLRTLTRTYYDIPLVTSALNITLHSVDTRFGYDAYGNRTTVTTYAGPGSKIATAAGTTWSAPGGGSLASSATTSFDPVYHALPTVSTPPISALSESAVYDLRMGTLTSITDPNGQVTAAEYDGFGRMVKLIKPGDTAALPSVEAFYADYEQPFRYSTLTREQSGAAAVRISSQFYDGLGRKIQTKNESIGNSRTVVADSQYDGLGRAIRQSTPRFVTENASTFWQYTAVPASGMLWTASTFDALGRPLTVTTPNGAQSRHVYVVNGNLLMHNIIDPNRHRVQQRSDEFGRLVGVAEITGTCGNYWGYTCASGEQAWAADATTTYAYSPLDLLTTVTDAQNNVTAMTYDSLGRKLTMNDPDMGAWSYTYDVDGNLTSQTDAKGQTLSFEYDAINRLTAKKQGATILASYVYDQHDASHANGKGRRTAMSDATGSHHWGYTARGEVASEQQVVGSQTYVTSRTYRADGQPATLTYPTGEVLTYGYTDAGQQRTIATSLGGTYLVDATYDALGQSLTAIYGNGVVTTSAYEPASQRLSSLLASGPGGQVLNRGYTYDPAGNVRTITDGLAGETLRYDYDDRDRLTSACAVASTASATCLGGMTFSQSYAYDNIGNLTFKAGATYAYGGGKAHAVSSVNGAAYAYDSNGNMLSGGGRTYAWNIENQPTQITKGNVSETYAYDGDNARVSKTTVTTQGGVGQLDTTRYVGGLVEYRSDGTVVSNYGVATRTTAGNPSTTNKGTLAYLHTDHLGSVSATTSGDSATLGAVAESQRFDPWGGLRAGGVTVTEASYTGQKRDAGTGLLFYNARYYDPALARFVSADSIVPNTLHRALTVDFHESGFIAALASENSQGFWFQMSRAQQQDALAPWGAKNPQGLNRYSYVTNNPLRYVDPTGHYAELTADEAQELQHQLIDLMFIIGQAAIDQNIEGLKGFLAKLGVAGIVGAILGGIANAAIKLAAGNKWEQLKVLHAELYDVQNGLGDFIAWERKNSGKKLGLGLLAFEDKEGGDVSLLLRMTWGGKLQRGYGLSSTLYYALLPEIHECRRTVGTEECQTGQHSDPTPATAPR